MSRLLTLRFAVCWMLPMVFGQTAFAQVAMPRAQGPGTLSGVVVDSLGRPVSEATVYIVSPRRTTLTRANGAFRFDSVAAGTYAVGARAIGYTSTGAGQVTVGPAGAATIIEMTRIAIELPTMTSSARRGGLSGVIGDTSFRAMSDVAVKVLGSGAGSATTDSVGEFYLPVKPGQYMVRLQRPGFRPQLVAVSVPADSGRRIAAWLTPMMGKESPIVAKNTSDLEERLTRRSPLWSKLWTNEDLVKLGVENALQAAERFAARRLDDDQCAKINGGPAEAPLWTIPIDEIELMETYVSGTTRAAKAQNEMLKLQGLRMNLCTHVVWLRK